LCSDQAIEAIWEEKATLQEMPSCSLEESLLVLLLNAFSHLCASGDTRKTGRLLIEISSCERFFTELKLNLCDKPKLKDTVIMNLRLISSQQSGDKSNDLFLLISKIQESLS
jgi:hypothetical protein